MEFETPQCDSCKHFRRNVFDKISCDAFPEGIPEDILSGRHDHTKPYKGDRGILYEKQKEFVISNKSFLNKIKSAFNK
jgi:hypothetical protein